MAKALLSLAIARRQLARLLLPKLIAATAVLTLAFLVPASAQKELPEGEGKKLLQNVCGNCHKMDFITARHLTKDEWRFTVEAMIKKGADATDEQFQTIIDYLAENLGPANGKDKDEGAAPAAAKLNVNKASADKLASFLKLSAGEAGAIVRYREANGNFKSWQALKKVPGLDFKKIEAKKDRLEF